VRDNCGCRSEQAIAALGTGHQRLGWIAGVLLPGAPLSADIATAGDVGLLVRRFYQAAIPDPLLGPLFKAAGIDWSVHIPLLRAFWQRELLDMPNAGRTATVIAGLRTEHDALGALLAELRAVAGGYRVPADGCATYRALYRRLAHLEAETHLHLHPENNLLFPAMATAARAR